MPASDMVQDAYAALQDVVTDREVPASARVAAARVIIDLAKTEQAHAVGESAPAGKKAAANEAARAVATAPTDGWGDDLMLPGARAN